jgi:hypothetical protein
MSTDTSTAASPSSTATTSSNDYCACVQYGFPDEKGPHREPKLRTIFEPIPDGANTASPIYKIPREQYERQDEFETGYEVKGGSSIATEIQDECEDDDRVLCPVHIESDAYHDVGPETLIGWFQEFVEEYLEVPFNTCTLYFSGRRSIHVHVPRFVSGEENREQLKELAKSFCEEAGADLDLGLYSRKRLFRLPGVEHEETGLSKVEIEPTWDSNRIFRESNEENPSMSASYADILWDVFVQESLTLGTASSSADRPRSLFQVLDSDVTLLEFTPEEQENEIETPLIERDKEDLENPYGIPRWAQYRGPQFSPYALAEGNPRSVAALEVKGGAFARKNKRGGKPMVPARFFGAVGCNGHYTKETEYAPLQLSEGAGKDYEKWSDRGFEAGDYVVVIGGQSRSSIIHTVSRVEALQTGYHLIREGGSRQAALTYLSERGYDVGGAGSASHSEGKTSSRSGSLDGEAKTIYPARENPQTGTEPLQLIAEQEGIDNLTYREISRIAHHHLQYGWEASWEWFEEQYGAEFDPEFTWNQFRSIVKEDSYNEYNHVEVPQKPL